MRFSVLGPLEVRQSDTLVDLGGPRQRVLLAALIARANQISSLPYLLDSVWTSPPVAPESNIRTYVAGLRRRLNAAGEGHRLTTRNGGYLFTARPEELDLLMFRSLADEGDAVLLDGEVDTAADRFIGALALWRGKPFEGLEVGPGLRAEAAGLEERRLYVAGRLAAAATRIHGPEPVVNAFRQLVAEYPLREELWAELIRALLRSGRVGAALDAYHQVRRWLAEELGVEPGVPLRRLSDEIYAGGALLSGRADSR